LSIPHCFLCLSGQNHGIALQAKEPVISEQ